MANYKIFISFKTSDSDGDYTESYYTALRLYDKLKKMNLNPFMSARELENAEDSNYAKAINAALFEASVFILVIDQTEQFNSDDGKTNWMHHEWETYAELARSGKKDLHSMFVLGTDEVKENLPDEFVGIQIETDMKILINKVEKKLDVTGINTNKDDKSIHHVDFLSADAEEKRKINTSEVMMEARWDYDYFNDKLNDISKTYNILDVGCEAGINTQVVFRKFLDSNSNVNANISLLSVDESEDNINEYNDFAKQKNIQNMHGEVLNFNEYEWEDKLKEYMKKYSIDKFDYVYCPSILHNFIDSGEKFLKDIYKYIRDGGNIYIRSFDDMLEIAYPDEDNQIMTDIVNRYGKCHGINDRAHARKLYKFLKHALFTSIKVEHHCIDTIDKDLRQLELIYDSAFGFRKSVFKGNLENVDKSNSSLYEKAEKDYNESCNLLERMHEAILDGTGSHYYAYFISVAVASKSNSSIGFYD